MQVSVAEAGDEKQRVAHVEVDWNIQDENQGREGVVAQGDRELDHYLNPGFPEVRKFRRTN